jgi:hypothetical protein
VDFLETLPADCPPPQATQLSAEQIVYRISKERPPTIDDFRSQRRERPNTRFNLPECIVCGVSVFTSEAQAVDKLKLPKFKGMYVAKVRLLPDSGHIQQTFSANHHTFWPFKDFYPTEALEADAS